jgi:rhodanese-related sulfurtransferase
LLTSYGFVSKRLENVVLIDTRGSEAAGKGHIEGAFSIPLDKLAKEKDQFPLDTKVPIIIHCRSGMRAQMAYNVLQNAGYQSRFLADKVAFIEKKPICCFKE